MSDCPSHPLQPGSWGGQAPGPWGPSGAGPQWTPPGGGFAPGAPGGGYPPGGSSGGKPITGGPATIAFHAASIDPRTGLPRGESPPASAAAVLSLVCGFLLCLGPLTGITAIAAGIWALRSAARAPGAVGGGTMAWFGIGLGVLNLLGSGIALIIFILQALGG